jgi:G3E family GTPase
LVTRIVIIGGFLGAGKTTLVNIISRRLVDAGRGVALVTNDQGENLVDTQYAKGMGFEVSEVLRGCFCCRFPDLINSVKGLVTKVRPEVIIAEPVGSCTDLQSTVIAPLRVIYPEEFTVAPLIVLVDGSRLSSDEVEAKSLGGYLRKHQIEEAEYVVLSKADLVTNERMEEVREAVRSLNPRAGLICYSAISGVGFDEIVAIIDSDQRSKGVPMDIDYDTYAKAEAELGWYNGQITFYARRLDSYDLGTKILGLIARSYGPQDIAHVKVMLRSESSSMKMSLVYNNLTVDWVKGSRYADGDLDVFVNGRVVSPPEALRSSIRGAVGKAMEDADVKEYDFTDDCFSPGRPDPTFRMKQTPQNNS